MKFCSDYLTLSSAFNEVLRESQAEAQAHFSIFSRFARMIGYAVVFFLVVAATTVGHRALASAERETVWAGAYCQDLGSLMALIEADRKGNAKALHKAMLQAGVCKELNPWELSQVLAEAGLHLGGRCNWRVLQLKVPSSPTPVWAPVAEACGPEI